MSQTFKNWFYFYAGIVFLTLAKTKNIIQGYSSPKPFSTDETHRCIEYDINVVENWTAHYKKYVSVDNEEVLKGKRILELGPGSDLGVGLYLLSKGVETYSAVDVNNLVESVPNSFYEELFDYLKRQDKGVDREFLKDELSKTRDGNNNRLNYLCRDDFNIEAALDGKKIDVVFSQAAFEHFDNIEETVKSISSVTEKGAKTVVLIDLKTHSRWIRDKDPMNIYRYPQWLYNLFYFRGIPNRIRPYQYKEAFEKHGWENVTIEADDLLSSDQCDFAKEYLNKNFSEDKNQMCFLSVWLCATRA